MNSTEMFQAINKGVPSYIPIEISVKTLIEQCASDAEIQTLSETLTLSLLQPIC